MCCLCRCDLDILTRNVKIIVEAASHHIYGHHGRALDLFDPEVDFDMDYLRSWTAYLGSMPRMAPYLDINGGVVKELEKDFEQQFSEVTKQEFSLPEAFTFYSLGSQST